MSLGKNIASKILADGCWDAFDPDSMADYDALFPEKGVPAFINIWTRKEGHHLGYIVIHHFLDRVGVGKEFVSTETTRAGEHLFNRLVEEGVLEKEPDTGNPAYPHRYKVIKNPMENLQRYVNSSHRASPSHYSEMGIGPGIATRDYV